MGLARVSATELATLPGLHDLPATRRPLDGLGAGVAGKLLEEFQAGRWRARVGD